MSEKQMSAGLLIFLVALIVLIIVVATWKLPQSVSLEKVETATFLQVLGVLTLIALILERSMEVFLTTFRAAAGEEMDRKIDALEEKIWSLRKQAERMDVLPGEEQEKALQERKNRRAELKEELEKLEERLSKEATERGNYRSTTRKIALWVALFMGLIVSALGFRALASLVGQETLNLLPSGQKQAVHIVDLILTGGLIAGGSDGIHKIAEVLRSNMEASTRRAEDTAR